MSILLTKGNAEVVFEVLDNHNINSALILDNKLKVLEIILEKNVDIRFLRDCKTVEEYNKYCDDITDEKSLTQEEFTFIKEMIKKYGK